MVTSVSLVGTLLAGLGLTAGGLLLRSSPARPLAIATVMAALSAVVLAIGASQLQFAFAANIRNLAEVEAWYRRRFRRAYPVIAAGLLLLAVLLAGATGLLVIITGPADQPTLTLQATGEPATVTVQVAFPGLPAGQLLHSDIVATAANRPPALLAQAISRAGASNPTTATLTVPTPAGYQAITELFPCSFTRGRVPG